MAKRSRNYLDRRLLGYAAALVVGWMIVSSVVESLNSVTPTATHMMIVVAASDISEGEKIRASQMRVHRLDIRSYIMDAMMVEGERNVYLGYTTKVDIKKGAPILKGTLTLEPAKK
jgi:Flp pilus assembly protein CpaB